jgi:aspartyl/glutamyl-tRNA(Asn/Gln) amidotransferase C subunit
VGKRVTIRPADVRRIAALAELDVPEADVAQLAEQLDRIVAYAAQLASLVESDGATGGTYLPGPVTAPLRPDEVRPAKLHRALSHLGAEMRDGFFLVPRLPAMEDE